MYSQREVGEHVRSHALGLCTALTMSPDVIVAGELESEEAIDAALAAAEAGVLVFATVPANGVVRALERLLSHFPDERRDRASRRLGEALGAVVSQLLLPAAGDNGRVLAAEVLVRGRTLGALIREGKLDALESIMRRSEVMQTMDEALARLVSSHLIRPEDAYDHARDKTLFAQDNP
jgi:Tfp pilus assembly pilus retraction ATPase PilT